MATPFPARPTTRRISARDESGGNGIVTTPAQRQPDEAEEREQEIEHDLDVQRPCRPDAGDDLIRVVVLDEEHALPEEQRIEETAVRSIRSEGALENE